MNLPVGTGREASLKLVEEYVRYVQEENWLNAGVVENRAVAHLFHKDLYAVDSRHYYTLIHGLLAKEEQFAAEGKPLWEGSITMWVALSNTDCPPDVLSHACRSVSGMYARYAASNPSCREEDRVYVALKQSGWKYDSELDTE